MTGRPATLVDMLGSWRPGLEMTGERVVWPWDAVYWRRVPECRRIGGALTPPVALWKWAAGVHPCMLCRRKCRTIMRVETTGMVAQFYRLCERCWRRREELLAEAMDAMRACLNVVDDSLEDV